MDLCKGIEDMPDEILVKIFSHLSLKELILSVRQVNHHWGIVSQDSELWSRLSYCPDANINEREIINVLRMAPKLQTFIPKKYMKPSMLEAVIENCKDIRKLELYMDQLSYSLIKMLIQECKNIEYLSITELECDSKNCFQLISKCSKLKTLKLCGNVPDNKHCVFKPIADGCPSLQHLDLRNFYDYTNEDLQYLINMKKHQLLSLFLRWSSENNKCTVPIIEVCKKLETLHVEEYSDVMTSRGFQSLKIFPELKCLVLAYFRSANVNYMMDVFENGMLSHLIELDLSVYDNFEDKLAHVIFKKCRKLKHVNLVYCPHLSDAGLGSIHYLQDLEYLNLCSCSNVTDVGLQHVAKCLKLKFLNLNGCFVTAKGMTFIFNLRKLQALHLLGTFQMQPCLLHVIPNHLKYLKVLTIMGDSLLRDLAEELKSQMPKLVVRVCTDDEIY